VHPDELDNNIWLFNCRNGTINLKTGKLQKHNPDDLITKCAPVIYDPTAECPLWLQFLNDVMLGRKDLVQFLQRMAGYMLTGDTSEQCFFIFYGTGENGKGTLVNTICDHVLGEDYTKTAMAESLMAKRYGGGIPNDLAALKGARLVRAAETQSNKRLSESIVKQLTGGDKITCRFLQGEFFEYLPQFKIIIHTNHKPAIRDTDHGIWRRVRLIPWDWKVPPERKNPRLMEDLEKEASGILNWMLHGCQEWQNTGLEPPEEVTKATEVYRNDMDSLADFLDEYFVRDTNMSIDFKTIKEKYTEWCEANKEREVSSRMLGMMLQERGFEPFRGIGNKKVRMYRGLGEKGV